MYVYYSDELMHHHLVLMVREYSQYQYQLFLIELILEVKNAMGNGIESISTHWKPSGYA